MTGERWLIEWWTNSTTAELVLRVHEPGATEDDVVRVGMLIVSARNAETLKTVLEGLPNVDCVEVPEPRIRHLD